MTLKVDIVIPTRGKVNASLLENLKEMAGVGEIIIASDTPLSLARKRAVLSAATDWVAMVDDDVVLPKDWLGRVVAETAPNVGAVASVALQGNPHVAAYDRVIGSIVKLNKVDTSPHINNVLVRRSLMLNYNPPPLFFGEDHHLKRYVEKSGYKWKVIPYLGAVHMGSTKNHIKLGEFYRRYGHYSAFQLARRMGARFIFTPYAAASAGSIKTFLYLSRINVEFISGWAKELLFEKL
jgi:glycosyltransferase involved in cell wall biosynthesis